METLNYRESELFIAKARWLTIFGFPILLWLHTSMVFISLLFVSGLFLVYNSLIRFYFLKNLATSRYSLIFSVIDLCYLLFIYILTLNTHQELPQLFYFLILVLGIRHGLAKYPLIIAVTSLLYLFTSVVSHLYLDVEFNYLSALIQVIFFASFGVMSSYIFRRTYKQHLEKEDLISELQAAYQQLCVYNAQVEELANTDPLTGLYNYRFFTDHLDKEITLTKRFNRPLSLIIIDIDHFKDFNDSYGHPAGDLALREVTIIFKKNIRDKDVLCRYGGEEFLILLPATGIDEAYMCAERIRKSVENHAIHVDKDSEPVFITVSGGVACYPLDASNGEQLLRIADEVLYTAKHKGRNKIHRRR